MRAVSPRDYYHEQDQKTLDALKGIPGFTLVMKKYLQVFQENALEGLNMASKIRLGPNQLPEIYNLLPPICEALGIAEPELYLEMSVAPNAYTTGETKTAITIQSGLLDFVTEDELTVVLAHECGHIACHHVMYHQMADMILAGSSAMSSFINTIALPLKLALLAWVRCSELSADRASAIYMQGAEKVIDLMVRLSAGNKSISEKIDRKLFMMQAEQYKDFLDDSLWNKVLQYASTAGNDHPLSAVRAYEIDKWCKTDHFKKLVSFMNEDGGIRLLGSGRVCPGCGNAVEDGWQFCKHCGTQL